MFTLNADTFRTGVNRQLRELGRPAISEFRFIEILTALERRQEIVCQGKSIFITPRKNALHFPDIVRRHLAEV